MAPCLPILTLISVLVTLSSKSKFLSQESAELDLCGVVKTPVDLLGSEEKIGKREVVDLPYLGRCPVVTSRSVLFARHSCRSPSVLLKWWTKRTVGSRNGLCLHYTI